MRTQRLRCLTATTLATVTTLSGMLAGAAPAQAAGCAPIIDRIAVQDVVIYGTSPSRAKVTVTAHDPCTDFPEYETPGISDVSGTVYLSDGDSWGMYYNKVNSTTWSGASGAYFDKYSALGRGNQIVEVSDSDANTTYRDRVPFYVRRNVVVSKLNASPEPVRKGRTTKITGLVKRLSVNGWGDAKYVAYVSHRVDVYFRPLKSKRYSKVAATTTRSNGTFAINRKATVDGCWKVYSTQTSANVGRWSTADCVDVR